ncbi:MAG TPA: Zn-ribbon domain-containing OB-fold protein [Chloroflexota bacterium]
MTVAEYTKPLPTLTKLNRPFFEGAHQGELRLQRCGACGHYWFPPSTNCPKCLTTDYAWVPVSGRGRVWSWIVMHQRYFRAFESDLPYNVAFIQLDEGPFMMSTLVGIAQGDIRCDLPVEVVFERATDEISVPRFRPREA